MFSRPLQHFPAVLRWKGLHVGVNYESDIRGSCEAGMEAVRVKRVQSMYERPDVSDIMREGVGGGGERSS